MTERFSPSADEDPQITCQACGYPNSFSSDLCGNCGASLREPKLIQRLLETDPEIISLYDKYAKTGKGRFLSGLIAVLSVVVFWLWLEYDWFEFLSSLALLTFPISLVLFLIFSLRRIFARKKLYRALEEKISG